MGGVTSSHGIYVKGLCLPPRRGDDEGCAIWAMVKLPVSESGPITPVTYSDPMLFTTLASLSHITYFGLQALPKSKCWRENWVPICTGFSSIGASSLASLQGKPMASRWGGILGLQNGIVVAPMGPDITGPELVAAVANAGGLGLIRAPSQPEDLKTVVARTRELTSKPFGVAIVLAFPYEEILRQIYAEKVAFLQVYFGDFPKERVDEAHAAGLKVLHQVGSVPEAVKAAEAGVDAVICQGFEAGGHIISRTGLWTLLPSVVDAIRAYKIPVIAAGGIVDGRGYVAALSLGAQGVCMGTRFLATVEANAHPLYKQQVVKAGTDGTEFPDIFGRAFWPGGQRALRTPFLETWKHKVGAEENENDQPVIGQSVVFGKTMDITRLSGFAPNGTTQGDVESMAMYAGTGSALIKEILPAAQVVNGILEEAQAIIEQRLLGLVKARGSRLSQLGTMV